MVLYLFLFIVTVVSSSGSDSTMAAKDHYSISMGSSFSSFGGHAISGAYINPMVMRAVGPRIRLHYGGIFSMQNMSGPLMQGNTGQSFNNNIFMIGGSYAVNRKLTIFGTGYGGLNNQMADKQMANFYNNMYRPTVSGMSLNFHYKLSPVMSIGGSVNLSRSWLPGYHGDNFFNNNFRNTAVPYMYPEW